MNLLNAAHRAIGNGINRHAVHKHQSDTRAAHNEWMNNVKRGTPYYTVQPASQQHEFNFDGPMHHVLVFDGKTATMPFSGTQLVATNGLKSLDMFMDYGGLTTTPAPTFASVREAHRRAEAAGMRAASQAVHAAVMAEFHTQYASMPELVAA